MADITAKVYCNSKTIWGPSGANFKFTVNYADGRNKAWANATPTLSLEIGVKNADQFEVGKSYTLTFSEDEAGE